MHIANGQAAGGVKEQPAMRRKAQSATKSPEPIGVPMHGKLAVGYLLAVYEEGRHVVGSIQVCPGEIRFDSDHEGAELTVIARLYSAKQGGRNWVR